MLLTSYLLASDFVLQILNLPPKIRTFFQTSWYLVENMPVFWCISKCFIINILRFVCICKHDEKPCFYVQKATFRAFKTYIVSAHNIHSYARNIYSYVHNMLCYDEKHGFSPVSTHFSTFPILFRKKIRTKFCRDIWQWIIHNWQFTIYNSQLTIHNW